ncbi:MAG: hypothetical protein R2862_03795 [Thermoanaerobaculia bacterium]
MTRHRNLVFAVVTMLCALAAGPGAARELHWRALEVDATVEHDGSLSIRELQRMVFTGDWNGGERTFRLFPGQELTVRRIVRIDPVSGVERTLEKGGLEKVDSWNWTSPRQVRWRSRRPSDPEFDGTEIDYRLEYRLTGAMRSLGEGRYRLDHDFAFADRVGVIESVVVRLTLAPEWRSLSPLPVSWSAESLPPGEGFVRPVELEFVGTGQPKAAAPPHLPEIWRWGGIALLLAGIAHFLHRLLARERSLGRWGGAPPPSIDRAWLEAHLFSLAPEVVGAAWDRKVGSAEVAALLARLTAEGKLASEVRSRGRFVRREDLHLELLVPRSSFSGYEGALISALFGSSTTTDTQSLRKRYQGTGFDPAEKIRSGVQARLKQVRGFADGSPKPSWKPTALLLTAGLLLYGAALVVAPEKRGMVFATLLPFSLAWLVIGLGSALTGQSRVGKVTGPAIGIGLTLTLFALGLWLLGGWPGATWLHFLATLSWALALSRSLFNLLATREGPESLARRRELTRARDYFAAELRKKTPDLEDSWFPYLLAFGLAPNLDRWFHRFGSASDPASLAGASAGRFGGSSSGGSGTSGWSGGGGSFGGGGASATWALAATAMSAGVAAPSSSGGGGGGGGGSSGGGGGGGW